MGFGFWPQCNKIQPAVRYFINAQKLAWNLITLLLFKIIGYEEED